MIQIRNMQNVRNFEKMSEIEEHVLKEGKNLKHVHYLKQWI